MLRGGQGWEVFRLYWGCGEDKVEDHQPGQANQQRREEGVKGAVLSGERQRIFVWWGEL